ncbi:MAG: hypothetical protein PHW13_07960 [Methylococcales bacterium]|nr:hypothetical protein [Methylococcales bacterium]
MNKLHNELERWLAGDDIFAGQPTASDVWIAGFDANRQVVIARLGPYKKLFLRPKRFSKRFYHQLYPLKIEHWPHHRQFKLFDDFCTVDMHLDLRFQATLPYVLANSELLPTVNQHIKATYADLLDDIFNRELRNLDDGVWVQTGLADMEKRIANAVRELLAIQQIQSQVVLNIDARFETFPAVAPGPNNVYLHVMKKSYEITEQHSRESARQSQLLEQQALEEKRRHFEYLQQQAELESQEQALLAEKTRRLLAEKTAQLAGQLLIEKRLHAEQIRHEAELKEMRIDSELRMQERQQEKQRLVDSRQLTIQLAHLADMEDRKVVAEIQRRENALQRQQQKEAFVPDNIQS